ncbi:MAG: hypothetical protein KDK08_20760 [Rhizobiaceae bacterium]|nr:hypothetical protein [Rhizobiaceae bacterium]
MNEAQEAFLAQNAHHGKLADWPPELRLAYSNLCDLPPKKNAPAVEPTPPATPELTGAQSEFLGGRLVSELSPADRDMFNHLAGPIFQRTSDVAPAAKSTRPQLDPAKLRQLSASHRLDLANYENVLSREPLGTPADDYARRTAMEALRPFLKDAGDD